jgi:hypothetical protein
MTEAEWLACEDPFFLLDFLAGKSERKFRQFAVAVCRFWIDSRQVEDPDSAGPQLAELTINHDSMDRYELEGCGRDDELWARECACYDAGGTPDGGPDIPVKCALVRDIFGNPFRPVTLDPSWRTATVTSLGQAIYDQHAFDRMPILADALEDAGCTNQDILAHCRHPGEHCRGCWAVDVILGRS